jgi:alpha-tubulin suppressor-like RCC1 family protein
MDSGVPVLVQNLAGAAKVAAGSYSTCALLVTGQVTCWGDNSSGALGDGTMMERLDPVTPSIDDVSILRAGNGHWCAVQNSGHVACWGQNGSHQTGSSQDGNVLAPFIVPSLSDVVAVSGGTGFTCVRRQTGDVSCWGTNNMGQLGNSTVAPTTTPTKVMLP